MKCSASERDAPSFYHRALMVRIGIDTLPYFSAQNDQGKKASLTNKRKIFEFDTLSETLVVVGIMSCLALVFGAPSKKTGR